MSYKVLDICCYVIDYSNQKDYGISNLKLQKILYFIQAYFLISNPSRCCFEDRIEAWDFGPVVPIAYRKYKHFGSSDIPDAVSDNNVIAADDKELIKSVIDKFADYTATDLVSLTHSQAPWIDAYIPRMNREITPDAISEYFNGWYNWKTTKKRRW